MERVLKNNRGYTKESCSAIIDGVMTVLEAMTMEQELGELFGVESGDSAVEVLADNAPFGTPFREDFCFQEDGWYVGDVKGDELPKRDG